MLPNLVFLSRTSFGYRCLERCFSVIVLTPNKKNVVLYSVKIPEYFTFYETRMVKTLEEFLNFLATRGIHPTEEDFTLKFFLEKDSDTEITESEIEKLAFSYQPMTW